VTNRRRSQAAQVEASGDIRGMAEWISIYQTYNAIFKLTELALLPHGLSLPQLHLLSVLQGGGGILTTGEVGREMVKASQTITGLVDRLEVQGFVERPAQDVGAHYGLRFSQAARVHARGGAHSGRAVHRPNG